MSENLLVTLGVQDKGATKQITALNRELKYLDKEYKLTSKSSKTFENSQEGLQKKLSTLEKKYTTTNTKLEVYKKKMTETKTAIAQKEDELEKLTSAEEVNEKAVEKVTKQLENMKNSLRQTEQNINLTEAELSNLTDEIESTHKAMAGQALEKYKREMQELGTQIEKSGEKISKFGQGMSTAGGNMMMLSAPMVAFAGYAVKASMEFEAAMSNVEAISGATGSELEKMSTKAKEMGANTSKSAKDAADAMSYMALAGWDTQQIMSGIEPVLRLAEAGNLDLGRASDLTTDSLSALGLSVEDLTKYLDVCAQAQRKSNTTADAMMEAYIACGGTLKNLNVPLEESATYLGILANRGKKGSEAGNALNSVLINLTSGAGQAGVAMGQLGLSAFDSEGKFKGMNVVLNELGDKLATCTEEQKNTYLAMIGGKTQIDTLNALLSGTSEEYSKLNREIKGSKGALDEMAKTMQNNAKGNLTKLKSQLEGLGIQIGEKLLPHINSMVDKLSKLIEWFGNLSEGTQQTIVKMGLLTFATGGALKAVGGITQGIGGLVSMFGRSTAALGANATATTALGTASAATSTKGIAKLASSFLKINPLTVGLGTGIVALAAGMKVTKTNAEMMSKTVLDVTDDMTGLEKTLNKVNNSHLKSREELIKLGLVYEEFGSNISEDFQEAVKTSQRSILDFNSSLNEMNFDKVLTEEEVQNFTDTVSDMCDSAVSLIKEKQEEGNNALSEMFKLDDEKIDESEKKVLEILQKHSEAQIAEVDKLEKEIYAIKDLAVTEKRSLNEQEIKDIEAKVSKIKQIELEALGGTQEEILYAKNEFGARIASLDLETASSLIQEKAKLRDDEIAKISASYDTQIQIMQEKLPLVNEEERVKLQEQIDKHTETRDKKIEAQNQLYDELLRITGEKNPEILGEINKYTGEVLTLEDKKAQELVKQYNSNFAGLSKITADGTYSLYNQHSGMWENVTVKVDERSGQIIGLYSDMQSKSGGHTAAMGKDMEKLGKEYSDTQKNIRTALKESETLTVNSSGQMVDANGKIVTSLEDITTKADGTKSGIVMLNGTPIKIDVNKEGVITNLNDIKTAADNATKPRTLSITTKYQTSGSPPTGGNGKQTSGFSLNHDSNKLSKNNIPSTYENMVVNGEYYTSNTVKSENLVNASTQIHTSDSSTNLNINYDELAKVIASTFADTIKNIKLQGDIEVNLDGSAIYNKTSNMLALKTKRRR
ncbi:MAG: phage tail tape measure protein [Sarcina sp.]